MKNKILIFQPISDSKNKQNVIDEILALQIPSDVEVDIFIPLYDPGKSWTENLAYKWEKAISIVKNLNYTWLFSIEDDDYIPPDALVKLLNSNKKVISGLYKFRENISDMNGKWMIFKDNKPIEERDLQDEIIEVDRIPFGCLLIHKEALEIFKPDSGADASLCHQVKEAGYNLYCHTRVIAEHRVGRPHKIRHKVIKKSDLAEKKILISLLTYNPSLSSLENLVQDILTYTKSDFTLYITDNNSDKNVKRCLEKLSEHKKIEVIFNEKNIGYVKSHNNMLNFTDKFDYLCVLNDDLEIKEDGWDLKCIEILEEDSKIAQIGAEGFCNSFINGTTGTYAPNQNEYIEGSFIFMPAFIAKKHGLFSEEYKFIYCEDSDLSLRLRERGYSIKILPLNIKHIKKGVIRESNEDLEGYGIVNKNVFKDKWSFYLKTKKFNKKYLFIRKEAFGDILLLTPLFRKIKEVHPASEIYLKTITGNILEGNPLIKEIIQWDKQDRKDYDEVIDLTGKYELRPLQHLVKVYSEVAKIPILDIKPFFYLTGEYREKAEKMWEDKPIKVLLDDTPSWEIRTWDKWDELERELLKKYKKNIKIIRFNQLKILPSFQLVGELLKKCTLLVGKDAAYFHISQALDVQSISLWLGTAPNLRITNPKYTIPIQPNIICQGCHHYASIPSKYSDCPRIVKRYKCRELITVEKVTKICYDIINERVKK